ncbi:hypothetical protein [Chryseobacterium luteum]|uniref:Uncharacterized protein n=1 Tax=Chryseobacterium luteum TaxID=421531 RepID=A0A085ZV33_9FLAO|nr:hypothetical protein [Chryseobacterium luteum]KFF08297.1 hypothetical protein IX38_05880 [Chryseobacterium luteum]
MLIILFLENTFKLYYLKELISPDIIKIKNSFFHKDYNSKENEGFIGFFDWLRFSESEIVGIRLCYFENQPYNNLLSKFPYVNSTNDKKWFELLFNGKPYNYNLSGDQDFTNNYVYFSEQNECLFTFGLDNLTDKELNSVIINCEEI